MVLSATTQAETGRLNLFVPTAARDTVSVATSVLWFPFGPIKEYVQQNGFVHTTLYLVKVTFARNLAYRATQIYARSTYSTAP
mgnify:CR=1 FL=1